MPCKESESAGAIGEWTECIISVESENLKVSSMVQTDLGKLSPGGVLCVCAM